jgi:V-type H+-transporting ATPase subunit H
VIQCIACNDIAQYLKIFPKEKKIIEEIGAKQRIIELMSSLNAEVRYYSLSAVQMYMTNL